MLSLGLDLSERPARAVVVDDRGEVLARGSGETGAAAIRAAAGAQSPAVACVAGVEAGEPVAVPGVKAVARCSPGAALLAAHVWIGAVKDARHAVCIHVGDEVYAGILLDGKPWTGAHNRAGAAA